MTTFTHERINRQDIFLLLSYAPEVVSHSSPSPMATTGDDAGWSVNLAPPTVPLDPVHPANYNCSNPIGRWDKAGVKIQPHSHSE